MSFIGCNINKLDIIAILYNNIIVYQFIKADLKDN